jgi:Tfp pilus assembly protein PilN
MSPEPVTLEFLAEQQRDILAQLRTMQDDALVSAAILGRIDGTLSGLVQEVRAMHSQHARLANRVRALEEDAP